MSEFEFNTKTTTNQLMAYANRKHYLAIEEAHIRQLEREVAREYRRIRRSKALNAALLIASVIGAAIATWSVIITWAG